MKRTQFVCNRELKVGDCTLFSRIVWRVTGKQSIPDDIHCWLYFAEEAR